MLLLEGDRTNRVDKTKGEGAHILREGNRGTHGEAMREGDIAKCENEKLTNNKGNAMEKGYVDLCITGWTSRINWPWVYLYVTAKHNKPDLKKHTKTFRPK